MKRVITIALFALLGLSALGQSNKFRASGLYQRAVDLFESKKYSEALSYAKQSRETLEGTNERLQYLFIMIYVNQKDWVNAQKEMQRFYDLIERRETNVNFSGTTDKLTDKEEAVLTRIMIDIEENAAHVQSPEYKREKEKEAREKEKEAVAKEIQQWFNNYAISSSKVNPNNSKSTGVYSVTCKITADKNNIDFSLRIDYLPNNNWSGSTNRSRTAKFSCDNISGASDEGVRSYVEGVDCRMKSISLSFVSNVSVRYTSNV